MYPWPNVILQIVICHIVIVQQTLLDEMTIGKNQLIAILVH